MTQSNYLPWRGYFAAMREADHVVLLDNVQYTRRDWRKRNRIRVEGSEQWLTVPVVTKGLYHAPISAIRTRDADWPSIHAATLRQTYRRSPGRHAVEAVAATIERVGVAKPMLSDVNREILSMVGEMVGITRDFVTLTEPDTFGPTERLVRAAQAVGATRYLTGPSAAAYLNEDLFREVGIEVDYLDYGHLPVDADGAATGGELSIVDVLARRPDDAAHLSAFRRTDNA